MARGSTSVEFVLPEEKAVEFILPEEKGVEFVLPEENLSLGDQLLPRENFTPIPDPIKDARSTTVPAPEFSPAMEGATRIIAGPEDIAKAKEQDRKIKDNDARIRLLKQGVSAVVDANKIGKYPGVSHYGKERAADIMENYVSPFAIGAEPQGRLTDKQQQVIEELRTQVERAHEPPPPAESEFVLPEEKQPEEKKGWLDTFKNALSKATFVPPGGGGGIQNALIREKQPAALGPLEAPVASTMDLMDLVLNAPLRVLSETFDTMRKGANYYANGMVDEPPDWNPGKAFARRPGASTGFPDFFQKAYKQAKGGGDLTGLEHVLTTLVGLPYDVVAGGQALRAIAPYKNMPARQAIQKNVEAVLNESKLPVGVGAGKVHPARVEAMAARTATPTAHASRVRMVREEMGKIGQMMGMDPRQLRQLDAALIQRLGEEGRFLEQAGNYPAISRMFPLKPEVVQDIQMPSRPRLAYGAGQIPTPARRAGRAIRSIFAADRGAPEGVQDVVRKAEGELLAKTPGIQKDARFIGRAFGKDPVRGEQVMLYLDAKATRARADKYMAEADANLAQLEQGLGEQSKVVEEALASGKYEEAKDALREAEAVVQAHPGVSRQGNKGLVGGVRSAYPKINKAKAAAAKAAQFQAQIAVAKKQALNLAPRVISTARGIVKSELAALEQGYAAARKSLAATGKGVNAALDGLQAAEATADRAAMGIARARLAEAIVNHGRGFDWGRRGFFADPMAIPAGATYDALADSAMDILDKEWARLDDMTTAGRRQIVVLEGKVEMASQGIEKIKDISPKFVRDRIVEINKAVRDHFAGLNWTAARAAKGELPEAAKAAKAGLKPWWQAEQNVKYHGERADAAKEAVLNKLKAPISKEQARMEYYRSSHANAVAREEELAAKGWDLKTPEEKKAWELMQEGFEQAHQEEKVVLGAKEKLDDYLPKIENTASKIENAKLRSRASGSEGSLSMGSLKHRRPWEEGIDLGGTQLHQFELHPGAIYARRMLGSRMAIATALSEQNTLNAYGTKMVRALESGKIVNMTEDEVKALVVGRDDVKIWTQKTGKDAGSIYLLDPRADDLLSRSFDPKIRSATMRTYQELIGWWKARATVTKLSFVNRNFFLGNLMNMGLGGVKIHRLDRARDAERVMAVWEGRHIGEKTFAEKTAIMDVLGGSIDEETKVFGGRRIGDVIDILEQNKVVSPGQVSFELGTASETTLPKPNWKQWRPWQPDFPLKNQWWNPMSSRFLPMDAISRTNQYAENFSKIWTFMDTVADGGQEWEGARKVADFLFNYDELSRVLGNPAVDLLTAFPKWKYKNYGLMFSSMMKRPDKLAQMLSLESGFEELDPTDSETFDAAAEVTKKGVDRLAGKEKVLPDDVASNEFFRVPFSRGEGGSRQYFPQKGATPMGQLGELSLQKLVRGDVSDWAEGVALTIQDWLGPWQNYLVNRFIVGKTNVEPTFSGSRRGGEVRYTTAPTSVSWLMDYIKKDHQKLYHFLTVDSPWVRQKKVDTSGGEALVDGEYVWDEDFKEFFEGVDPGFSVTRRLFPPGEDSQMYSGRHSVLGFGRLTDATNPRLMYWNEQSNQQKVIDPLAVEKRREERAGERRKKK